MASRFDLQYERLLIDCIQDMAAEGSSDLAINPCLLCSDAKAQTGQLAWTLKSA